MVYSDFAKAKNCSLLSTPGTSPRHSPRKTHRVRFRKTITEDESSRKTFGIQNKGADS